jgi:hypothetical protein
MMATVSARGARDNIVGDITCDLLETSRSITDALSIWQQALMRQLDIHGSDTASGHDVEARSPQNTYSGSQVEDIEMMSLLARAL